MSGFDAEFIVASSKILDEGMTTNHNGRGPVGSQSAHRAKSRLESAVIALNTVVWRSARCYERPQGPAHPQHRAVVRVGAGNSAVCVGLRKQTPIMKRM